jgi:alpha-mannosidase
LQAVKIFNFNKKNKMNTRKLLTLSFFIWVCQAMVAEGDFTPLTLSGYNADVICNTANCSGAESLDGVRTFYSAEKYGEGSIPETIISKAGVEYILASFNANNALTLGDNGTNAGSLTLSSPVQTAELWLLGISANSSKKMRVTVNYTDDTRSDPVMISFPDWHQGNGAKTAYYGLGRVKVSDGSLENRFSFGLFERTILTDPEKTVRSVDFSMEETGSYTTVFAISAFKKGIERTPDKTLYMVANAHFDTQWDWDVQTSINQYVKETLEGNFNLLDKYPHYTFNFEGAIKYMFAKEYYPALYARLKGYVQSGRWHISGGSVDANDVMVPAAESIIRNFLYGQKFYEKEFGVKGGSDVMLPDCFGFPYSLPTLAKHCGIVGFHSQKLSWGSAYSYDALPHFNLWRGVDGSEIYAVHKPGAYVTQYKENMAYNNDVLNEILENKQQTGASKTFRYFGTGDRGGSVSEETADWLEKGIASNGLVQVKVATPDQFFADFTPEERSALPIWDNELPMTAHGAGCYTSQAILKYWNRKNELLADATEKSSVWAHWLGGLPYQSDIIRDTWVRLLWHQFHDDLTGTSIPRAYSFSNNDHVLNQLNLSKTLNNAVGAVARKMDTQVTGTPIVVYNPLSIERNDVVEAQLALLSEPLSVSVYDPDGKAVAAQKLKYENGVLSFIFAAKVPSLGYATYDLRLNDAASSGVPSELTVSDNTIENEDYKITLNTQGNINSIVDKKQGNKELLKYPIRMALQSNNPGYWMSWEISWSDIERSPVGYVDKNISVSIAENGPLRAALKISRTKNSSEFVQYIRMTSGVNADRIDFVNEVNWQTKATLLKVVFPLQASNPKATYDLSIGAIERGNRNSNLYEVAGHQWADLTHSDNSYGVSILNDCKYGWDKENDNTLRLTLIHTPGEGSDRKFQKYQDLGLNKFTYSFYRHLGKWNESTQWEAAKLNQPLIAYETPKHAGSLGKSVEFVGLNTDKVAVKALKKAESSDEIIVRVYELTGESHENVAIRFPAAIVSAKEVNGVEDEIGSVAFSGDQLTFSIAKYQPKTFAVQLSACPERLTSPSSDKVDLPYNIDVMSADAKIKDGEFGNSGFTYPAELLSDELIADGIAFAVGPRGNGALNAVLCAGQEINMPQNAANKKLYLLAASQNKEGSGLDLQIDGTPTSVHVEYFAGFVGQWETVFSDRKYRKENTAFTATHCHNVKTATNDPYSYLYIFKYEIPLSGNAQKLTLPNNSDVILFAVSLSDNENDDTKPVSEVMSLPEYSDLQGTAATTPCSPLLRPASVSASGYTNDREKPEMATDDNPYSKWCDNSSSNKWIEYNFGRPVRICQWNVLHSGLEGDDKISSDFRLLRYEQGAWVDVDEVTGNTDNKTVRTVEPFVTERVRLRVTKGEQSGTIARIYAFEVFGTEPGAAISKIEKNDPFLLNYPNPFSESTTIRCALPKDASDIHLAVYDYTGKLCTAETYPVTGNGYQDLVWQNKTCPAGLYFYSLLIEAQGKKKQFAGKMIVKN